MLDKRSQQILMLLKPDNSETTDGSSKIIENIRIENSKLKAKLFGSEMSDISVSVGSFDSKSRIHGYAELQFPSRDRVQFGFGFDDVIGLKGNFIHGKLIGIATLELQDFRTVYLSVKNGVAHGPAIIAGFVPILPVIENIANIENISVISSLT
jgi:hypothetical protein